jgi:hypothetical protein
MRVLWKFKKIGTTCPETCEIQVNSGELLKCHRATMSISSIE